MIVIGLEKFANQQVSAVSKGEYIGDFEVNSEGKILEFTDGINNVQFGFRYTGVIQSNVISFRQLQGMSQIAKKKVDKILVKFENSILGLIGSQYENLVPIEYDKNRNEIDAYTFNNFTIFQNEVEEQEDSSVDPRNETNEFQLSDLKLFTGDYISEFSQITDEGGRWIIVQDSPAPMKVLGVWLRGTVQVG